jgi:hypothetical protein
LAGLGSTLILAQKFADAEPVLRECLTVREKSQPDDWTTFNTKSMLGNAHLAQKKYAEAEPLLLAGFEGLRERETKIPPQSRVRLTETVGRLVEMYEALGKKTEADKWRKELEARRAATERPSPKP